MICPVTVVPTLAPMMMPRDCRRVMIPAPTRPEVITMVAVLDCIMAVTASPSRNALMGLFVTLSIATFRVPEELSFRPSPISRMPYRNMASPPNRVSILKKSIVFSSGSLVCETVKFYHAFGAVSSPQCSFRKVLTDRN